MMSFIAQAGAVPLGYVSAMIDSEDQCLACSEQCFPLNDARMQWRYLRNFSVFPPLPDLILSNTPPPSPLRRTISCPFFPTARSNSHSAAKHPAEDGRRAPASRGTGILSKEIHMECHSRPLCRNSSYHEIREREEDVEFPRANRSHTTDDDACDFRCHSERHGFRSGYADIPQFLWELPPAGGLHSEACCSNPPPESSLSFQRETSKEKNIRSVGLDLRRIADRFQLDHGKVLRKSRGAAILSLAFPEVLTRCLSASVLCLIWWRILNRFR